MFPLIVLFLIFLATNISCDKSIRTSEVDEKNDVLFVQMIFRHGDRTPIQFYKNDPWKDPKHWEDDLGQVTKLGKQQQFELGLWIQKRYSKLLKNVEKSVYFESSEVNRAIVSAKMALSAIYDPTTSVTETLNMNISVPVHVIPRKSDNLILALSPCPAFDLKYSELCQTKEVNDFHLKHQSLYEYLTLKTGEEVNYNGGTVSIQDTLKIEKKYNKTLPEWSKKIFPGGEFYKSVEEVVLKTFSLDSSTPELAKYKAGFLLKDILDRFTNKSQSLLDPDLSMWAYSGHDTTICRMLNSLGLLESMPPYSSCIIFEMRKINGIPHLQIFFKNSPKTPEPLHIPNCGTSCPLSEFYRLYKDILPTKSFEEECEIKKKSRMLTNLVRF